MGAGRVSDTEPTLGLMRERIEQSASFCRWSDAEYGRDTDGWRTFDNYATVAGRGAYVPPKRVLRVLGTLVRVGVLEAREDGCWRVVLPAELSMAVMVASELLPAAGADPAQTAAIVAALR